MSLFRYVFLSMIFVAVAFDYKVVFQSLSQGGVVNFCLLFCMLYLLLVFCTTADAPVSSLFLLDVRRVLRLPPAEKGKDNSTTT